MSLAPAERLAAEGIVDRNAEGLPVSRKERLSQLLLIVVPAVPMVIAAFLKRSFW